MRWTGWICAFALMGAAACDAAPFAENDAPDVALRPWTGSGSGGSGSGGVYMNTNKLDTHRFAELDLQGQFHDGVRLAAVQLRRPGDAWLTLDEVWSDAGELKGLQGGELYEGADFLGSRWDLQFSPDLVSTRTMWIDAYDGAGAVHRYTFKYQVQDGDVVGATEFLCAPDEVNSHEAIAFPDLTVDENTGDLHERAHTLHLGCVSGAVAKARLWGYPPWEQNLPDFEAIVRIVRADYCGDGNSWTTPGIPMQVRDIWGVNEFVDASDPSEALWGPAGALCVARARLDGLDVDDITCGGAPVPVCDAAADLAAYPDAYAWTRVVL